MLKFLSMTSLAIACIFVTILVIIFSTLCDACMLRCGLFKNSEKSIMEITSQWQKKGG
jgi:hypothetical protein